MLLMGKVSGLPPTGWRNQSHRKENISSVLKDTLRKQMLMGISKMSELKECSPGFLFECLGGN